MCCACERGRGRGWPHAGLAVVGFQRHPASGQRGGRGAGLPACHRATDGVRKEEEREPVREHHWLPGWPKPPPVPGCRHGHGQRHGQGGCEEPRCSLRRARRGAGGGSGAAFAIARPDSLF
ncbi:hypothetical protein PVAP13_1NG083525 [Panicum virgatum]|uniref:Uncharacterized protein n=1 Tax=Panicum virgatum TaxID=38727 RepID=A0A8T0WP39_PANVG|nr:hypothetical protein PVAP13_1NG083525 [Panicum virgatum]